MILQPIRGQRATERREVRTLRMAAPVGEVVNVSKDGFCLETTSGLRVGSECRFRLSPAAGEVPIVGWVRWCRLVRTERASGSEVQPVYAAGVEVTAPRSWIALAARSISG